MEFPSPIYGASFKLKSAEEIAEVAAFPSPIYGASFKQAERYL